MSLVRQTLVCTGDALWGGCDTHIEGTYKLPVIMQLPEDDQQFILDFILSGGSLKDTAAKMGLSYPTVRNRLDDIIANLKDMILNS